MMYYRHSDDRFLNTGAGHNNAVKDPFDAITVFFDSLDFSVFRCSEVGILKQGLLVSS